jgi:long-chain acyl-CoA synthetase
MSKRDICVDRLKERAALHAGETAYFSRVNGRFVGINWRDYHHKVRAFAKALIESGFSLNDKLAILGSNRLEWPLATMAAQYAGGVSVGVYTASSKDEVSYVVDHCDAQILVVENLECFKRQVDLSKLSKIKLVVLMSDEQSKDGMMNFGEFLKKGEQALDTELDKRQSMFDESSVGTMIYTSGTTGNPKSVMLSHRALAWIVRSCVRGWGCNSSDRLVSYLPLAHIAEQMFTVYAPIESGMKSYFTPSFDALSATIKEVEPTVFFGVPRVYEKMYSAIKSGLKEKGLISQSLFQYFSKVSLNYYQAKNQGKMPSLLTTIQYQFGVKKIFNKLKERMGFKEARICVSGAAPISKDIVNFFTGIDLPIYEVYGQSENCGPTSYNLPGQSRIGSVGKAILGSEIKIAKDGEILLRGPHVFEGYYKDEAATKEVLKDGWLYTGDIGELKDGYLFITDRKKDLLITAGGKNISPQNLEAMLKELPYVQAAVVVGDSKKYLCALLSPDLELMKKKAKEVGISPEKAISLVEDKKILQEIKDELFKINDRLAPVEQIKRFFLLPNEFSVASGEYTPTMKVKRKFVNQKYQTFIDQMYQ